MAKAKKVVTEVTELETEQPIHIPDIPAQMTDEQAETVKEETDFTQSVTEDVKVEYIAPENDEVRFLKAILHKQHTGCFGRHLDDMINERIKTLLNVK